jgi:purine-binding chemotaxis protein CheW
MMTPRSLLIFALEGQYFGLDAARVRESVWLPELTPAEEFPVWVTGLFSLRGRIVPVMDLHLRLGHGLRPYAPSNQVVVLESGQKVVGLIVSEVLEVVEIAAEAIQPIPDFAALPHAAAHLVVGEARVGENLVALLDVERLLHLGEGDAWGAGVVRPDGGFCPQATAAERALFHARALALREVDREEDGARLGLAVVELGGERFGVALAAVKEFCSIHSVSPIPCCPTHILGAINLRGAIITLIDPRSALQLAATGSAGNKAVIGMIGEQPVALAVDEVHDVIYPRREEVRPAPQALREGSRGEILGTVAYAGGTMMVLDLPLLLSREDWCVEEHV